MKNKILYFDILSGISGDMAIGALLDLGIDINVLKTELSKLKIEGFSLSAKKTQKNGITGTKFDVILNEHNHKHDEHHTHEHHHRTYTDIINIIDSSELNENVKKLSKDMFLEIGLAEAKVHDKSLEEVHFHEVGAIDSIVDIVGVAICIDILSPEEIISSPVHVGTGFVKSQHGVIPVPAPATLEILKGLPIYSNGVRSELVTPTGATIIKTLATDFTNMPEVIIDKIAYGHGSKDLEITNTLRVVMFKKKP